MMEDIFFELISVSVGHVGRLSRSLSSEEWMEVFVLARKQSLEGVLYRGVERLPMEQRPDVMFMMQWFGLVKRYELLNAKINRQVVEVSRYFSNRGIRNCVLKGQGVATYYPEPLLRVPGDIDLWVEASREQVFNMEICSDTWLEVTYLHLHSKMFEDTDLELHVTPSWMSSPFLNFSLQKFFKQCWRNDIRKSVQLTGSEDNIYIPSLDFNRFYLLLHIYHHLFGQGVGLRQLMDYYYVLMQGGDEVSLGHIRELLAKFRLMRFAGAVMYVEQKVFGLPDDKLLVPVNVSEGKFLLREIMLAGNFGKHDKRIDRVAYRSTPRRFVLSVKRNIKFLWRYPQEVAWDPLFRSWLYLWRRWKWLKGRVLSLRSAR